jgi:acetylglutamate kinase
MVSIPTERRRSAQNLATTAARLSSTQSLTNEGAPKMSAEIQARLAPFRDAWFVVKVGGELVVPGKLDAVAAALAAMQGAGVKLVVIHGGGPQATDLTKRLGLTPQQIAGRRVTDADVLRVMKQALAGEVSVDIASIFRARGVNAVALHGVSAGLISAVKRPPRVITGGPAEPVDLGLVGDVVGVNTDLLETLVDAEYLPVVASIGGDAQGGVFNINADVVAARVAVALGAKKLLLVAGVSGVLRDIKDPSSRIARLTPTSAKQAIDEGIISGGMIAKVEEALSGVAAGIPAVHVCGAEPGALLDEALNPGSRGTLLEPDPA